MIWQRYLFFRLLKVFLFILGLSFSLYSFVDLATRSGKFVNRGFLPDLETLLYYIDQFSYLLPLFFALSFLLATIQVLFDLNIHQELVALQMGGLSIKKMLKPFFILATLLFFLSIANHQWLAPEAKKRIQTFQTVYAKKKKRSLREHVHTIGLADGTELIYQRYDEKKGELFDLFWIETPTKLWHMKSLDVDPLRGRYVDLFERDSSSKLVKTASFTQRFFPEIEMDKEEIFKPFIPFENRSLSQLFTQIGAKTAEWRSLLAHLLYKFSHPLLFFLIPFAVGPIACRFSRHTAPFLTTTIALFAFVSIMMVLDGMLILGENQVISPFFILAPLILLYALFFPAFRKTL